MSLIFRFAWAIIVWAVVWLVCLFVGGLLKTVGFAPLEFVGKFLEQYAIFIGFLAGVIAFIGGVPARFNTSV
jgi:hypothetical protein